RLIMGPWYDAIPSELRAVIHEEINRLPAAYRAVLILCGLEGRSPEWTARELGWPLRRLERRLARALECLRLRLAQRGAEVPEGSWDCGALRDLGAIVPKSLIESTVTAATGEPAPVSGSSRPQDGLPNRWQDDPCGPPGWRATMPGDERSLEESPPKPSAPLPQFLPRLTDRHPHHPPPLPP